MNFMEGTAMRYVLIAAAALALQGCWFVFLPGSLLEPGQYCVGPNAKVGDRIRFTDGRTATVKEVFSTSSRCQPHTPVRANVDMDK
jgi:hypothetical protein